MVTKSKFIDFRVDPKGSFRKALLRAGKKVDNLKTPFKLITMSFYKTNMALFPEEGTNGPDVFTDLSENYKRHKDKKFGFIYPILRASGDLMNSLTKPEDQNTVATVINKKTLLLGTKIPYAGYLQFGTKVMPARPYLVVGTERGLWAKNEHIQRRKRAWMEILEKYCVDSLKKRK
tara:strand:- start:5734 stop:6261 length:528 start_codon:yes stop_codon:yes gene_type:complete